MRLGLTVTEFVDLAAKHSMVPVWAEVIADLETPMSVASRIYPRDCVIILESAERGLRVGRYSFICFDPLLVFESRECSYLLIEGEKARLGITQDALATLQETMMRYSSPSIEGLPPLLSGCVGYVGYDYVRSVADLPRCRRSELPDVVMVVPRCVLAFDHLRHTLVAAVNCTVGERSRRPCHDAVSELHTLIALCRGRSRRQREPPQIVRACLPDLRCLYESEQLVSSERDPRGSDHRPSGVRGISARGQEAHSRWRRVSSGVVEEDFCSGPIKRLGRLQSLEIRESLSVHVFA